MTPNLKQKPNRPQLAPLDLDRERAVLATNMAWSIVRGRLPYPTHAARLHALAAAGVVPDEVYFARLATEAPA